MPARNHVHKLKLHTYKNGTRSFFCIDDCDYTITRELALGKMTICHRCGQPFQMNQYSLNLAKPHCEDCHLSKAEITARAKNPGMYDNKGRKIKPQRIIEAVMNPAAVKIESDLESRMKAAVQTPVEMLTEEDFKL